MSYVTIYCIGADGHISEHARVQNAWTGAMAIWRQLAEKYGVRGTSIFDYAPLWELFGTEWLSRNDRIALGFTFDRVWVARKNLPQVSAALRELWAEISRDIGATIPGIANALDTIPADAMGACFNQTSVCSGTWYVPDPEADPEESRLFRFGVDKTLPGGEPWELFEALDELERGEAQS